MENLAYKILENIILGKINPYVENITGVYQNGFRDGRSVIYSIFALAIINEKTWEYNQNLHYLFIDFQKVYDCTLETRYGNVWKNIKFLKN